MKEEGGEVYRCDMSISTGRSRGSIKGQVLGDVSCGGYKLWGM